MNAFDYMYDNNDSDTIEMEVITPIESITTIDRSTTLSVGARVAEQLFNELRHVAMDFGIPLRMVNGALQDPSLRLVAELLPIVVANGHSTDMWLGARLQNMGFEKHLSVANRFNKWLRTNSVLEPEAITEWAVINGHPAQVKRFLLTQRVFEMRDEIKAGVTFTPRSTPDVSGVKRVKGQSILSDAVLEALHKQDTTPLRWNPITSALVGYYKAEAMKSGKQEAEAFEREANAVEADFNSRDHAPFYLTHTCDYRFRMYARGGFISTQGSKLQKVAITFADAEIAPDMDEIHVYLGRLLGCKGNWVTARALGEAEAANPTMVETKAILVDPRRAIVRLDGTCNGIQWLSAFANDPVGMAYTNLTGKGPRDLYTKVAESCDFVGRVITSRKENLDGSVTTETKFRSPREQAKMLLMPYGYGASVKTLSNALGTDSKQINAWLKVIDGMLPVGSFLAHIKAQIALAEKPDVTKMSVDELLAWAEREREIKVLEAETGNEPEARSRYTWELPDGAVVIHEAKAYDRVQGLGGNFSMRLYDSERADTDGMARALAPNIIHSIDALHARMIINQAPFPVIAIHDSFGCHSSNVKQLREIIRNTFQDIIYRDTLNQVMSGLGFTRFAETVDPEQITNPYMFS